ncbi:HAD family hydrolase [Streptomyces sp. R302]|uniref:HAD family hydrolase n=1 Tax=unclassified Streptomyces TaxID=2593676 RepID=UPI00145D7A45|nr:MULTISPECIES: HAD family hydrolase [unclassified Streptomyces]NML53327.1 HAD family hydrolase [Streptomyces sp. R301]NML78281.1 HAD family hydrolase [Streptomyces sp. R302]
MTIRAVLWDVDDTIFDYAGADRAGMRAHLAAEGLSGLHGSVEDALRLWKELTELHWRRYEDGLGDWRQQRRWRVRDFLDRQELADAETDAWFDRYVAHYEAAWELFPDALPVLDLLAAEYRQAVLSNSSLHAQEPKLRALGVRDHFEAVLCAAELGAAKPSAEAFHAACAALGLAPHEVAYVGDRPDIDALGAEEAGLHGIWLDRADTGGQPGLRRITDLHQLPPLLRGDTRFGAPSTFG